MRSRKICTRGDGVMMDVRGHRFVAVGREGKRPYGKPSTSLLFHDDDDRRRHRHCLRAYH